ncbi:MAG: hypothetical protein CL823_01760 [Crocinitomicaceae bacterium]|nr:hypothetical protein [Crocinitomicaceae bacterium]|tara:strand:- start:3086 stop:3646 length:561 start_codon:yes stop_codon:yes gene_type:complete
MASKGFKLVGLCLLGYLVLNGLLGNMPFELSFIWNLIYNYTVMIIIAVISAYWGIKHSEVTPLFIDGFKFISKQVLLYSIGVSLMTPLWHFVFAKEATQHRTDIKISEIKGVTDKQFNEFVKVNPNLEAVSKEDWIENQIASVEFFSSAKIVTSIYLLAYLVIGLFISLVATFLWTRVWFVQQRPN